MTTPTPGTPDELPGVDCGAPATVEALRVGADNTLLSDVTAGAEHAAPHLATATDIVHHDATPPPPASASGPVPALGDRSQVDGRAGEVWDVQPGPAGGHEVVLLAENLDHGPRWHAPGDRATVTWQATTCEPPVPEQPRPRPHADRRHRSRHPRPAGRGPDPGRPGTVAAPGAQQTPPAPEAGDVVCGRGQQWQVLHGPTAGTPSGPHHGLARGCLEPGQSGEILGVVWQTEAETQILTPPLGPAPDAPAGIDAPGRADLTASPTRVPTTVEQELIDRAHAEATDEISRPSPRQALDTDPAPPTGRVTVQAVGEGRPQDVPVAEISGGDAAARATPTVSVPYKTAFDHGQFRRRQGDRAEATQPPRPEPSTTPDACRPAPRAGPAAEATAPATGVAGQAAAQQDATADRPGSEQTTVKAGA